MDLDTYFAMARGRQSVDVTAMEMTKWFDTNYHYIVPELGPDTKFSLSTTKPFDEHAEAMEEVGIDTVPVLVGPVSFLLLSKPADGVSENFDPLDLLEDLVEVYGEVIEKLAEQGATWVQFDEPCFVEDRTEKELDALRLAYEELGKVHERPRIVVKTYFDHVGDAYGVLRDLPIEGVGLDFTGFIHEEGVGFGDAPFHEHGGRHNAEFVAEQGGLDEKWLFAGIVDGRNVWINHLEHSLDALEGMRDRCQELVVSTSCSLLHTPDRSRRRAGRRRRRPRRRDAFMDGLRRAEGRRSWRRSPKAWPKVGDAIADEFDANDRARDSRRDSHRTRNPEVRARVEALTEGDAQRDIGVRRSARRPSGRSWACRPSPQPRSAPSPRPTRSARPAGSCERARSSWPTYEERMRAEIDRVIYFQEEIELDVLVHGEPERNDMVQYFGEQMLGLRLHPERLGAVIRHRATCVRRSSSATSAAPAPMTVEWISYAQSKTEKPVKGMLTGPVTMLEWSFVRDDQPHSQTCEQLALAIRDEVADLEKAGISIIHVDEPAIREGLPLRRDRWDEYLSWAIYSFRVATAVVADDTQVQTHMCYSDFGDILEHIQAMDADVTLIEAARSRMELLHHWERSGFTNDLGPGVYDIHSPRVPIGRGDRRVAQ